MSAKNWWTQFLAALGYVPAPDPRVAEARRQQQAVTGDVHSRKADLSPLAAQLLRLMEQEDQYRAAAACAERGLYGAAAEWAIRASSEHGTCRVVNPEVTA